MKNRHILLIVLNFDDSIEDIIFKRVTEDPDWNGYQRRPSEKVLEIIKKRRLGRSRIDFALAYASWTLYNAFRRRRGMTRIKPYRVSIDTFEADLTGTKFEVEDPKRMSIYVKRAAKLFGASLTGICKLNRDWLYAEVDIPEKFENVIVMAIEMDSEGIATSPHVPAAATTGVGYSRMAFILACMGEFIRDLGYEAIECGNDTALSIPLAIDAGLGELGRNGLLITHQYGPRVRLCKILTGLPLEPDQPIEFGVKEFCKKCKFCAKHCEAGAISMDDEPSFKIACRSNNPGVLKWYVNVELCYLYWCENGIDCSTCIKVCPYNIRTVTKAKVTPREFWETENIPKNNERS
ncbi:TPA: reductive dehalogenase [Candidatus Bathyarchaeota archaeon]|nr:reductive dehalogenase [Candidatus Bathyarchaeota archaeon]